MIRSLLANDNYLQRNIIANNDSQVEFIALNKYKDRHRRSFDLIIEIDASDDRCLDLFDLIYGNFLTFYIIGVASVFDKKEV